MGRRKLLQIFAHISQLDQRCTVRMISLLMRRHFRRTTVGAIEQLLDYYPGAASAAVCDEIDCRHPQEHRGLARTSTRGAYAAQS